VREEADVIKRRPWDRNEPLFSKRHVLYGVLQGLVMLAVVLMVVRFAQFRGLNEDEARAQSYTGSCQG
jgi:hypothetical protein